MAAHDRKSPKRGDRSTSFDCNNAILRLKTIVMIMIAYQGTELQCLFRVKEVIFQDAKNNV